MDDNRSTASDGRKSEAWLKGRKDALHSRPKNVQDPIAQSADYIAGYEDEIERLRNLGEKDARSGKAKPDTASAAYYEGFNQVALENHMLDKGANRAIEEIDQGFIHPQIHDLPGEASIPFLHGYYQRWNEELVKLGRPPVSPNARHKNVAQRFVSNHPVITGVALASAALVTFQFTRVLGTHLETGGEQAVSDCALDYQTPAEIALDQLRTHGNVPEAKASAPEAVEALSLHCSPEQSARTLARVEDIIDAQGEAVVSDRSSTTTTQPGQGIGD